MAAQPTHPRILNLDADGKLDPLAQVKLYSIMLFPENAKKRHAFTTRARRSIQKGDALPDDAGRIMASYHGAVAGSVLIRLIQMHEAGGAVTLERAVTLARMELREYAAGEHPEIRPIIGMENGLMGLPRLFVPHWHAVRKALRQSVRAKDVAAAFRDYQAVAHLWATCIIGNIDQGNKMDLDSADALANLLAIADNVSDRAAKIELGGRKPSTALPRGSLWRVTLPSGLRRKADVHIPPFSPTENQAVEG